jgi:hypothetical protein
MGHVQTEIRLPTREDSLLHHHSAGNIIFKIGIVGGGEGGVQLGSLGTAATNSPIVLVPGDYYDGEIGGIIGRGNRSTRRKPAPVPLCPPQTPNALPGRGSEKPATNRLSYGTVNS